MSRGSCSLEYLEGLYKKYHHRCFVHPDPLEFLYDYPDVKDREITGLIASSLAYGRVNQILKSVSSVLKPMDGSPAVFLQESGTGKSLQTLYSKFKHRFTTSGELCSFLRGTAAVIRQHGSLRNCYMQGYLSGKGEPVKTLLFFVTEIKKAAGYGTDNMSLLPDPAKGSSCKRLNLYLRWLVRSDGVDPGGWPDVPCSGLIVPLDTHMFGFAKKHGLTDRNSADISTALQITEAMKKFSPDDPVKYDFSITRIGIRGNNCPEEER